MPTEKCPACDGEGVANFDLEGEGSEIEPCEVCGGSGTLEVPERIKLSPGEPTPTKIEHHFTHQGITPTVPNTGNVNVGRGYLKLTDEQMKDASLDAKFTAVGHTPLWNGTGTKKDFDTRYRNTIWLTEGAGFFGLPKESFYSDKRFALRRCDSCQKTYQGPTFYCSLECARKDFRKDN